MIPITRPYFSDEETEEVRSVLRSGWATQGPKVKAFEAAFGQEVQSPYACAVTSCTTALHLGLLAVGVKPGDVVITVSHSFIATANAIRYCWAEPVFVDIEEDSFNMSAQSLEIFLAKECHRTDQGMFYKKVRELAQKDDSPLTYLKDGPRQRLGRVSAIVVVHQLGFPADLPAILAIARRARLPVVEDAAYAIGSKISLDHGKTFESVGRPHGEAACFSFHPRKILVTGEGGMLTTRKKSYDKQFRLLRHQGMAVSDLARHTAAKVIFEDYPVTGYNYRLTDIQAAIGLVQLRKLPQILARRRRIALKYQEALQDVSWLALPSEKEGTQANWASYPVRLNKRSRHSQKKLMQSLLDQGIASRPGVMNIHEERPYRSSLWMLSNTEAARRQTIQLPLFPEITDDEAQKVIEGLKHV